MSFLQFREICGLFLSPFLHPFGGKRPSAVRILESSYIISAFCLLYNRKKKLFKLLLHILLDPVS